MRKRAMLFQLRYPGCQPHREGSFGGRVRKPKVTKKKKHICALASLGKHETGKQTNQKTTTKNSENMESFWKTQKGEQV